MQIINLWKASFVPGFHKHRLHLFYSFGKIVLLLNREGTGQKLQVSKQHQNRNTQKWLLHFPTTACSSLAKHSKRWKQKNAIPWEHWQWFLAVGAPQTSGRWESSNTPSPTSSCPCLFKEHLNQNCASTSRQEHLTREHRSTKSYSCKG